MAAAPDPAGSPVRRRRADRQGGRSHVPQVGFGNLAHAILEPGRQRAAARVATGIADLEEPAHRHDRCRHRPCKKWLCKCFIARPTGCDDERSHEVRASRLASDDHLVRVATERPDVVERPFVGHERILVSCRIAVRCFAIVGHDRDVASAREREPHDPVAVFGEDSKPTAMKVHDDGSRPHEAVWRQVHVEQVCLVGRAAIPNVSNALDPMKRWPAWWHNHGRGGCDSERIVDQRRPCCTPPLHETLHYSSKSQPFPHATRPSSHIVVPPSAQFTLQLPTLSHRTAQSPSHVGLQFETLAQRTVESGPTRGGQSLRLSQTTSHSAPQSMWHVLTLLQRASQPSPQTVSQFGPPAHADKQVSPQVSTHSFAKSVHSSSQSDPLHSSSQRPPLHSVGAGQPRLSRMTTSEANLTTSSTRMRPAFHSRTADV